MPLLHILILALVQGITEFLPISSSGHLVLLHEYFGQGSAATQENLLLDVAVHVGTLFAVLLYFRADILSLFFGLCKIIKGEWRDEDAQLGLLIVLSSIPVIIAGFLLHKYQIFDARNVEIVAWTTLGFGVLLWVADRYVGERYTLPDLNWKSALIIGLAQVLALIPGTSRSGITMTAARGLGFTRTEAARYSLLLSIVAISGAGVLGGKDVLEMSDVAFTTDIALAAGLAFISGYIAIALMMGWLRRASFTPFAIYRVILGAGLLGLYYGFF